MNIDEMIAVLQAAKDGKEIQYTYKSDKNPVWLDGNETAISWDFSKWNYRVKPEPREWRVSIDADGRIWPIGVIASESRIKVREVLE